MNEVSITPLGSVSPYPKGNCNLPGFLFKYGESKILLDCGSGISRLLSFPEDLKNLIIILSHLHKDHYSDLSSFAYASYVYHNLGFLHDKVKVYIPPREGDNTNEQNYLYNYGEENFLDFDVIPCESGIDYNGVSLNFLKNVHQGNTYSIKLEVDGVTVIYGSDTGWYDNLIEFSKNADLLILESSFLKGQIGSKYHLFAYQAGLIANEASVKQLMLTHFWPEIRKQEYVNEAKEYFLNVIPALEGEKLILRREKI